MDNSPVLSSGGEIQLANPNTSILQVSGALQNSGLLDGSGRIVGTLQNNVTGELSVATAQSLTITGAANTNAGMIQLSVPHYRPHGPLHRPQQLRPYQPKRLHFILYTSTVVLHRRVPRTRHFLFPSYRVENALFNPPFRSNSPKLIFAHT
jgi:hypothetical protein